jgi:hypothetical protein
MTDTAVQISDPPRNSPSVAQQGAAFHQVRLLPRRFPTIPLLRILDIRATRPDAVLGKRTNIHKRGVSYEELRGLRRHEL